MTRIDFFKKLGRYILLMLMAIIVIALGKKGYRLQMIVQPVRAKGFVKEKQTVININCRKYERRKE